MSHVVRLCSGFKSKPRIIHGLALCGNTTTCNILVVCSLRKPVLAVIKLVGLGLHRPCQIFIIGFQVIIISHLIVDGTVNYISTTRELRTRSDKKEKIPEFYAQIGLTLNLKDAASGNVINSQVFEVNKSSWSWFKSTDSAIKDALEGLRKKLVRYYNSAFPYSAHILERGTEKKDKQKELYIDLGASHGLQEGTHLAVYVIGSIGGKETRKQIGRLKVNAVEGDEVSLCKVVSGGKDIKAALDAGEQLLIISTD